MRNYETKIDINEIMKGKYKKLGFLKVKTSIYMIIGILFNQIQNKCKFSYEKLYRMCNIVGRNLTYTWDMGYKSW